MISEQEKQAILNGAFGIDRAGRKMKYVGKSASSDYPNFIIVFNEHNEIMCGRWLREGFTESKIATSDFDVVGLWEDKPEPFDLERALAGEPVRLRGNKKAYVKYLMPDEYTGSHPVKGYIIDASNVGVFTFGWCLDGRAVKENYDHYLDIVSMWKDPEPVSKNVTYTLPRTLKEPQDNMWYLTGVGIVKSVYGKNIPSDTFDNRPYFGSREDAEAWFKAMQDSCR